MVALVAIGFIAIVLLGWNLHRRFGADRIGELNNRRRPSSRMVGRGEFVDGNRHLEVALALTRDSLFYENADMQACVDLDRVREIEYDTKLATGNARAGGKVLRLRSNSQTFEFVLADGVVAQWHTMLPARRPAGPIALTAVPAVPEDVLPQVAATA